MREGLWLRAPSLYGLSPHAKKLIKPVSTRLTASTAFTSIKTLRFTSAMSCLYFLYCRKSRKKCEIRTILPHKLIAEISSCINKDQSFIHSNAFS